MYFLYNVLVHLVGFVLKIIANFNPKMKLFVDGRKNVFEQIKQKIASSDKSIWFHAASLGEFEQGIPVMEKIKIKFPNHKIIVTFFSPSGFEVRKNNSIADLTIYLPLDTTHNAKQFLDLIHPQMVFFIKYEYWPNYLNELKKRQIKTYLISGILRENQVFFKWYGSFYRKCLTTFDFFFVQNESSKKLLQSLGYQNVKISGDTRFDRVITAAEQWKPIEIVDAFCGTDSVMVAGSTWAEDENILADWMKENNRYKLIIAPHEIKSENINRLKTLFPDSITFSELSTHHSPLTTHRVLIIDNIGYLSRLYKYASVCYVGGGFNKSGHHNILEAAVYGKPVITGPNFEKFKESVELKKLGGSFSINNVIELKEVMLKMDSSAAGTIAENYVKENAGATDAILNWLQEKRLFTNA